MTARFAIADVASLLGEPSRAGMLLALLDGGSLAAGELARAASLSAPATSLHLTKLASAGLLKVRQQGRHRYYRLASAEVALALEALGAIATASRSHARPVRSLSPAQESLRGARTCYDHLAGVIAVALADMLERDGWVRATEAPEAAAAGYEVTRSGATWFAEALQIDVGALSRGCGRRPLARRCLDWTERRPHVAGALGAAVLQRFLAQRWIAKVPGTRAVRVTVRGRSALARLGIADAVGACGG